MKNLLTAVCTAVAAVSFTPAQAVDITANAGMVTEYIFRGIQQTDGKAAAQGGVDIEESGFYAGTWFSNVETGLEYDLYAGYEFDVDDFSFGIGGTGYFYTNDVFDDTYVELNLSAGWKFITIDYAVGEWDGTPEQDYDFLSITLEYEGFYGLFGTWGDDFDGDYFEVGYGNTLSVGDKDLFDYTAAMIYSDDKLSGAVDENGNPDEELFFYVGVSKTFDLFSN